MTKEIKSMLEKIEELYKKREEIVRKLNGIDNEIDEIRHELTSMRKKRLIFSFDELTRFLFLTYERNGYMFIDEFDDKLEIHRIKRYDSFYDGAEYTFIGKHGYIWFDERTDRYVLLVDEGNLKTHAFWDKGCLEGTGHEYKSDSVIAEIIIDSDEQLINDKKILIFYAKKNQKSVISAKFYAIHKNILFLLDPFKASGERYIRDVSKLDFEYPKILSYIFS